MAEVDIKDLLKYKEKVEILSSTGTKKGTVWIRLLGDYDLEQSYKRARVTSAQKRSLLRTIGSLEYEEEIAPIPLINTIDECIDLIKNARVNTFVGEAYATVDREEPVKIADFAVEPDAPTLEEQEKLDKKIKEQQEDYEKKIRAQIDERLVALESELRAKTDEEIYNVTKFEMSNILALQEFQAALTNQKMFRASYKDESCKRKAFDTIEDYINAHTSVKQQLIAAYNMLELAPDDIKN